MHSLLLPKWLIPAYAKLTQWLVIILASKELARMRSNVEVVLGLPAHSVFAKMFYRQCYRHQALCLWETFKASFCFAAVDLVGFPEFKEQLLAAKKNGKGVILVTGHIGSWEILAGAAARAVGEEFSVLAKPGKHRWLTNRMQRLRRRFGIQVLWSDRRTILKEMLSLVRGGGLLGFVMDQKPEGRKGVRLSFLGHGAEFVSGPAAVACKTNAAVLAIFCTRQDAWKYKLDCQTLYPAAHGESESEAMTQKMVEAIATKIREYPEQWTWNYKRWNFQ